ncbi:MAG: hypothetical protein J6W60_09025 [Treponema sp.]|nr:hypothetical protein [Treponema sp.]
MKKTILCASILAGLFLTGCGSKSEWNILKQMPAPDGGASFFVGFHDQDCAISVGEHGLISATSDGGANWIKAENSSLCRFCLDIVDSQIAWSGGNGNDVRVTRDGGKTWQAVTDCKLGAVHRSIDFIDDMNGWIANEFYIASTNDGGNTWNQMKLPKLNGKILSFSILSSAEGYVVTKGGDLIYTNDGGNTWTVQPIAELVSASDGGDLITCDFNFYDKNRGELVASIVNEGGTDILFFFTEDGGATWNQTAIDYPKTEVASEAYFSSNGKYITLTSIKKDMTVYKRKE